MIQALHVITLAHLAIKTLGQSQYYVSAKFHDLYRNLIIQVFRSFLSRENT